MIRWASFGLVVAMCGSALAQTADVIRESGGLSVPEARPGPFGGQLPVGLGQPQQKPAPAPAAPAAPGGVIPIPTGPGQMEATGRPLRPTTPIPAPTGRRDLQGDPLPAGALARFGTSRLRHGPEIVGLGFTPDGKYLASVALPGGGIRLWAPATGKEVARFDTPLTNAALARDGRVVVVDSTRCRIWSPAADGTVRDLPEETIKDAVSTITVHPDCQTVAVGGVGKVVLIDLTTGKARGELKSGSDQAPFQLVFSPDGRWLAGTGQKTGVWVWDLKTGRRARTYPVATGQCRFAFSPDGSRLALNTDKLRMFPLDSEEEDEAFVSPDGSFEQIRFSTDGKWVFALAANGGVVRLNAATGDEKDSWPPPEGFEGRPRSQLVALSPEAEFVAAVDESGSIRIWAPRTGKGPAIDRLPGLLYPGFSADGRTASCIDTRGQAHRFDPSTGKPIPVVPQTDELSGPQTWDAQTGRGAGIFSTEDETGVRVFDGLTNKTLSQFPCPIDKPTAIGSCRTDPDRLLVVGSGVAAVVRISTGKPVRTMTVGPADRQLQGVLSPDGRLVALTTTPISVWEVETGKKRHEFAGVGDPYGCAFSPDGRLLAALDGGLVQVFNLRTGGPSRRFLLAGANPTIITVAFSPDGAMLVTGSLEGSITLWDVLTGNPIMNFDQHEGEVAGFGFSHDGKRLISTSSDGTALVWDLAAKPDTKAELTSADEALRLLAAQRPEVAQQGMEYFYRKPDQAVRLLGDKVPVPEAVPAARIAGLVQNLGSEDFQTREAAVRDLEAIGAEARPAIQEAAAKSASPEVVKRAEGLLARFDGPPTRGDDLRVIRAVEVLEGIGTAGARAVLAKWAAGPPMHRQTTEALAALARLKASGAGGP